MRRLDHQPPRAPFAQENLRLQSWQGSCNAKPHRPQWQVFQMSRRTQVAVDRELLVRKLEKAAEEAAAANEDVRAAEIRRWRA